MCGHFPAQALDAAMGRRRHLPAHHASRIIGYRSRIWIVDELIRHAKAKGKVWFATHEKRCALRQGARDMSRCAKAAVVTGGAHGIGTRLCHSSWRWRGYDIALVDLLAPEMKRTGGEIEALGRRVRPRTRSSVAIVRRAHEVAADVARQWNLHRFPAQRRRRVQRRGISRSSGRRFDRTIAVNLRAASTPSTPSRRSCCLPGHRRAHRQHVIAQRIGGGVLTRSANARLRGSQGRHSRAHARRQDGPKIAINATICPGVIEIEPATA